MFLDFLNPFRGIIETNLFPHVRAWRTDFWGKLKDAFFIFAGSSNLFTFLIDDGKSSLGDPDRVRPHLGLFDWVTLGIPFFLEQVLVKVLKSDDAIKYSLGFILGLVISPIAIARILIAGFLVFNPLSLIVITAVEFISQRIDGMKLKEEANKPFLTVREEGSNKEIFIDDSIKPTQVVVQFQSENNQIEDSAPFFTLPKFIKENDHILGLEVVVNGLPCRKSLEVVYLPIFSRSEQNSSRVKAAHAYLKLNFERVIEGLEGYVAEHQDYLDPTISNNCKDCREVLDIISPPNRKYSL